MEYAQEYLDRGEDRLGLHVYPSPEDTGAPVVVIWPAMGVPARYYRPFAAQLAERGLAVVVVDLRGTGTSTPRPSRRSRYGYADLAADVGAVLDHLSPRLDGRRVLLLGHSLGGQACALYLALSTDERVAGLALVAVGLPWFRSYPRRRSLGVLVFTQGIAAVALAVRVWPGWGFGGRQARGVIRDWAYTARHGRFPRLGDTNGGADVEAALASVRTPVLAISVEPDQYTPAATLDQLCGKMRSAVVERHHVTAGDLGAPVDHLRRSRSSGHFTWVRASALIAARVTRFASGAAQVTPTQHDAD